MGYAFATEVFDEGLFSWNSYIRAFLEVILVGWIYELDQFIKDLDAMELPIGRYMAIYLKICIKFASPVVLIILIIVDWVHHGKNHHGLGHHSGESFPSIMEHLLTYASLIFLPIFAGWEIFKIYRKGEEKELLFKPTKEWFEVIHD